MAQTTLLRRRMLDDVTVRNLSRQQHSNHMPMQLRSSDAFSIKCPDHLAVDNVFRHHGTAYRDARAGHLSGGQRRVMGALEACRSATLGGHVEQCDGCRQIRIAYNSCRNRHCLKCQGLARAEWLANRQADLLPVPYFHVVFTVPAPIAEIALHNKAVVYGILFAAAAECQPTSGTGPFSYIENWTPIKFCRPRLGAGAACPGSA